MRNCNSWRSSPCVSSMIQVAHFCNLALMDKCLVIKPEQFAFETTRATKSVSNRARRCKAPSLSKLRTNPSMEYEAALFQGGLWHSPPCTAWQKASGVKTSSICGNAVTDLRPTQAQIFDACGHFHSNASSACPCEQNDFKLQREARKSRRARFHMAARCLASSSWGTLQKLKLQPAMSVRLEA